MTPGEHKLAHSCWRKRRYQSRTAAKDARKLKEAGGAPALSVYRCRACGGWHLTKRQK